VRSRRWAALAAGIALIAACGSGGSTKRTTVTVFAAASLTKAFTDEAAAYEKQHPGTRVVLSFAGSQSLVAQIQQGAPADVLATADEATMAKARAELKKPAIVFAHNELALVTARGNPLALTSLQDLARPGIKVVLAGPTVPVGKAAAAALAAAHVTVHPVSLEDSVTGVVGKVRLGEADAGIAYVTDLADGVDGVPLPGTTTNLAIGGLTQRGEGFVAFVRSAAGQAILRKHRFQ
jgi:molybdate transport system substrate-binding protein